MSTSRKHFLHELGKSSLLQNAINCQLQKVLKFPVRHYLAPLKTALFSLEALRYSVFRTLSITRLKLATT